MDNKIPIKIPVVRKDYNYQFEMYLLTSHKKITRDILVVVKDSALRHSPCCCFTKRHTLHDYIKMRVLQGNKYFKNQMILFLYVVFNTNKQASNGKKKWV